MIAGLRRYPAVAVAGTGLLLGMLAAFTGCFDLGGTVEPRLILRTRLVAESPDRIFQLRDVLETDELGWELEDAEDLSSWKINVPHRLGGGFLRLQKADSARLIWPAELSASSVCEIQVLFKKPIRARLLLFWSGQGEPFDGERRLVLDSTRAEPAASYLFKVAEHPSWQGEIADLRLDVHATTGGPVEVEAIRPVCPEVRQPLVRQVCTRPFKLELDHEIRDGYLAVPECPIELDVDIAEGSVLRFAYGLAMGEELEFRAIAEVDPPRQLFSTTVSGDGRGVWRQASVDLTEIDGESVRLILEARSPRTGESVLGYWGNPAILAPRAADPANVILIVVDTLRADRMSLYGHGRQTTPRIDAWAKENAVVFKNTVAAAPWTLPSHISLLTGLDPLSHGMNHDLPLPDSFVTLAESLRSAGYTTVAVTGGVYLHPQYNLHQGFDRFRYWPSESPQDRELESGIAEVLKFLEDAPQPFFLFFHTYEVHVPYHARQPYFARLAGGPGEDVASRLKVHNLPAELADGFVVKRRYLMRDSGDPTHLEELSEDQLQTVGALYDSGIAYVDDRLGSLFDAVRERHLGERTAIVLTSDHGEALGEKGLASHAYLYDFNLMVPLIIALPGHAEGPSEIEQQVRSVDISATVLSYLDLEPPGRLDGVSLLPLMTDGGQGFPRTAVSYASSTGLGMSLRVSNRYKYIFNNSPWPATYGGERLYRLAEDPAEEVDLAVDAREASAARGVLLARYREVFKGLRATLVNDIGEPLKLVLASKTLIIPNKIKATDLAGAVIEWQPKQLGVTVPPESSFDLFFEAVDARSVLEVEVPGESPRCRQTLEISGLKAGARLDLSQHACRLVVGDRSPVARGLIFDLEGAVLPSRAALAEDPDLRKKLEALGYAN